MNMNDRHSKVNIEWSKMIIITREKENELTTARNMPTPVVHEKRREQKEDKQARECKEAGSLLAHLPFFAFEIKRQGLPVPTLFLSPLFARITTPLFLLFHFSSRYSLLLPSLLPFSSLPHHRHHHPTIDSSQPASMTPPC